MQAEGVDPEEATNEEWLKAIDKIKEAADSGQIRRFTGNDYTEDLTTGNIVAAIGWSGDASIDREPERRVADADRGLRPLVGQHGDPGRRPEHARPRSAGWTSSTSRRSQADIAEYINYVTPVDGVEQTGRRTRSWPTTRWSSRAAEFTEELLDPADSPGAEADRGHRGLPGRGHRLR